MDKQNVAYSNNGTFFIHMEKNEVLMHATSGMGLESTGQGGGGQTQGPHIRGPHLYEMAN